MKKISTKSKFIALLLTSILLFSNFVIVSSASESEDEESTVYVTSDGISYDLRNITIYWEELENQIFTSSQSVIDGFYRIHNTRVLPYSGQYDVLGHKLTPSEMILIIENFSKEFMEDLFYCRSTAINTAIQFYPDFHGDGQKGNAFQHAFWVMLMCRYMSPSFALDFSTAHEDFDDNSVLHKTMDLNNNSMAYNYYLSKNTYTTFTDNELKEMAVDLVESGSLDYIIFDYEYPSIIIVNRVTLQVMSVSYATANLYAKTNSTVPYNIPEPRYIYRSHNVEFQGISDGEYDLK